jgi:hypothetical protein
MEGLKLKEEQKLAGQEPRLRGRTQLNMAQTQRGT